MRREGLVVVAAAALAAACGGSDSGSTTSGPVCTPGTTTSVAMTAAGVSPKAVCVLPGGTVTFRNDDTVAHSVQPTTAGADCAPLDVGPVGAGQSATTPALPNAATCAYSDGTQNAAFQGTVYVQTAPSGGPGH